ncbi:hypothetical protein SDJN02_02823, partial [Cucurbita argyrosperma subsp. argyrosperma]
MNVPDIRLEEDNICYIFSDVSKQTLSMISGNLQDGCTEVTTETAAKCTYKEKRVRIVIVIVVVDEKYVIPSAKAFLHDNHFTIAQIVESFVLIHSPFVPSHEKDSESEAMGDKDQVHVGVSLPWRLKPSHINYRKKLSKNLEILGLGVCTSDSVINIRSRFSIWKTVEKSTV